MIGRKKPEGLTRKQYDRALSSYVKGATEFIMAGMTKQGMTMAANVPEVCWELTRPGVSWDETDLTDKLDGQARKYIQQITFVFVIGEDGGPIIGFADVLHVDGTVQNTSDGLPHHIGDQVNEVLKAHEAASGYDMSKLSSFNEVIKKVTSRNIEQQVEEFTKELDDLNKMWQGGGD